MTISQQITQDFKDAMKTRDELRLSCLRMLKASLKNKQVEKGDELEVDVEQGTIKILKTGEVLKTDETPAILLEIYRAGGMLEWIKSRRHLYKTLEQDAPK